MAITRSEVEQIAKLARLGLSEEETEALTEQLDRILTHMEALRQLDTLDVVPTFHILPLHNVFRADEVQESLPKDVALANAAEVEGGTFKVPRITDS